MYLLLCSGDSALISRWSDILSAYQIKKSESLDGSQELLLTDPENDAVIFLHDTVASQEEIGNFILNRPARSSILIGANNPNDRDGICYLRYGANGYTNCYISSSRLCQAIQIIRKNGVWFRQSLMQKLISGMGRQEEQNGMQNDPLQVLSSRQKEVASLVADGFSNHKIGETLFISERTVKVHLSSIYKNLNIQSRLALALLVKGNK